MTKQQVLANPIINKKSNQRDNNTKGRWMSKPSGDNKHSKNILIVISDLYVIALPCTIYIWLCVRIPVYVQLLDVSLADEPEPHLWIKHFKKWLWKGICEHKKVDIIDKNALLLIELLLLPKIAMAMDNVDHKACIKYIWDRIVKAKGWMIAWVRVVSLKIGEQFDLCYILITNNLSKELTITTIRDTARA